MPGNGTEIAKAYVQIIPSADGIASGIKATLTPEMDEAGGAAGESFISKFGSIAKKAVGALGLGKLIGDSLSAGGDLQQSFGGLDTIYGEASESAKRYAAEAAAAGISANDYAEQAVAFGASLKQAFGGDTTKAVEAANTAIMDMTDNAAKMGTDIELIQNAYKGFEKGNYTMLDNLKLGYGGTQKEMKRLLAKATELSGVEYDISNLGDVYSAIHVIQEDLGLTGVAAEEAKTTLSGSFGAMKAAAENALAALTGQGNLEQALSSLGTTFVNFVQNNGIPMIQNLLLSAPSALLSLLEQLAPVIETAAVNLIVQLATGLAAQLPQMLESARVILTALGEGLIQAIPIVIEAIPPLISSLVDALIAFIPEIVLLGVDLFVALVTELPTIINTIVRAIPQIISGLLLAISNNIDLIVQAGVELFVALIALLPTIIVEIVAAVPEIVGSLVTGFIQMLPSMVDVGRNLLLGLRDGIVNAVSNVIASVVQVANSIINGIKNAFGIHSPSREFAEIGEYLMLGLSEGIEDNTGVVENAMSAVEDITIDATQASLTANVRGKATMLSDGITSLSGREPGNSSGEDIISAIYVVGNAIIAEIENKDMNSYMDGKLVTDMITKLQHESAKAMGV